MTVFSKSPEFFYNTLDIKTYLHLSQLKKNYRVPLGRYYSICIRLWVKHKLMTVNGQIYWSIRSSSKFEVSCTSNFQNIDLAHESIQRSGSLAIYSNFLKMEISGYIFAKLENKPCKITNCRMISHQYVNLQKFLQNRLMLLLVV